MKHIIGLGNIGDKYTFTRHNVGFSVLDFVREKWNFGDWIINLGISAHISLGEINGEKVSLVKPNTYMNKSGDTVYAIKKRGADISSFAVLHDDIDMPLGKVRIIFGRGSGGHRGIESITEALGTKNFLRFKIGISPVSFFGRVKKPQGEMAVNKFVLGEFGLKESKVMGETILRIEEYLKLFVSQGKEKTISACKG